MIDRFFDRLALGMSFLIIVTMVCGLIEIVLDKVFGAPTIWSYDLIIMLNAVCFLGGGAYALQRGRHITISLLRERMRGKLGVIVDRFNLAIISLFLLAFTWFAGVQALNAIATGETSGHAWDGPMPQIIRATIFFGGVLLLIRVIANFIQRRPLFVDEEPRSTGD